MVGAAAFLYYIMSVLGAVLVFVLLGLFVSGAIRSGGVFSGGGLFSGNKSGVEKTGGATPMSALFKILLKYSGRGGVDRVEWTEFNKQHWALLKDAKDDIQANKFSACVCHYYEVMVRGKRMRRTCSPRFTRKD